ncbi:MAG TPA: helix-turn-helix domain-containing protein [Armatimonadota bacterium]|jgi:AraC-like DNA-binding protein
MARIAVDLSFWADEIRAKGYAYLYGEPGVMVDPHRHQEVEVNLIESGEAEYLFAANRIVLSQGELTIFWAAIPHSLVRLAPSTSYHCIHLSLARFLQWQMPNGLTARLLHGEMVRERDRGWADRDLALFTQWSRDRESPCPDAPRVLLLELEARLRRLAWSLGEPARAGGQSPSQRGQVDVVERMAVFITNHYNEPITTADIAGDVGLHPNYAMALFRNACGMTLGEYLTHQRLSQAQRLLATTEARIVDVAFESGFGSVSQFYALFTRLCGQTPREFRAQRKGGNGGEPDGDQPAGITEEVSGQR